MNDFLSLPDLAFLAIIAAAWRQIRAVFDRLRGFLANRIEITDGVAVATSDFLLTQCRVYRWGDVSVKTITTWVRPLGRVVDVAVEGPPLAPALVIWHGKPLLLRTASESNMAGGDRYSRCGDRNIILMFLKGTIDLKALTLEALTWTQNQESTGKRYRVKRMGAPMSGSGAMGGSSYHNAPNGPSAYDAHPTNPEFRSTMKFLHWSVDDIGAPKPEAPFDAYQLNPETEACREDFRRWVGLKDWYRDRGIPWRRGHLLYGPPGTGKTALVRALAQESDMPVFIFDLAGMPNHYFTQQWLSMQESAPCVALIEDIDGIFEGRRNVLAEGKFNGEALTFDCLLQALGGVETCDGVFVFITTNCPEKLDAALCVPDASGNGVSRPGRIDRAYCLPLPNASMRKKIIARICGAEDDTIDLAETEGMTAAQTVEWSITRALGRQWEGYPTQNGDFDNKTWRDEIESWR